MINSKGAAGPWTLITIVFLILFILFIIQNAEVVDIRLLFWKLSLSRAILLLWALVTGLLIGFFLGWETAFRKKKKSNVTKT